MTLEKYSIRREKLRRKMCDEKITTLLISYAANRYYLSGFELHDGQENESSGWLLITEKEEFLLTDSRFKDAAKEFFPEENIFIYTGKKYEELSTFFQKKNIKKIAFESNALSFAEAMNFKKFVELVPTRNLVELLRMVKDSDEIDAMRKSCLLNHKVVEKIPNFCEKNLTERELAWEIEYAFRTQGASSLAFPTIVGVNENAALPHAIPGDRKIANNTLCLVDTGARLHEYCSDQTRTFWIGDKESARFREVKEQVCLAQEKAIKYVRAGVFCKDVYAKAKESFEQQGLAQNFTHSLGHGIGLETHELPSLNSVSETKLEAGMIITIEPGLYWADWGGVRWEYEVLVTEDGCEIL